MYPDSQKRIAALHVDLSRGALSLSSPPNFKTLKEASTLNALHHEAAAGKLSSFGLGLYGVDLHSSTEPNGLGIPFQRASEPCAENCK